MKNYKEYNEVLIYIMNIRMLKLFRLLNNLYNIFVFNQIMDLNTTHNEINTNVYFT
jgi:hypothetical protein